MKHILVVADPLNTEQHAFRKAQSLAKLTVADLHVVSFCFESILEIGSSHQPEGAEPDIRRLIMEQAESQWQKFIESQSLTEPVSHEIVWEKYIHKWVLEHCKTVQYDLIVKTGHRSEGFFYTPTDWHLFRESSVPVYCISKPDYKAKKVVLVALDLTAKHPEKQKLNEQLLEAAFLLSVQTNSVLKCCYAVQLPSVVKALEIVDVPAKVHEIEDSARARAKELLDLYDIPDSNLHIREGAPENVINTFARKLKAQCVVVGSMGRKGIEGKLIGNTADKVIHTAKSDLLVI